MILVIVEKTINPRTGQPQTIVSHGVDLDTGKAVILPMETPETIGAVLDTQLGEFVLPDAPAPSPPPRIGARRTAARRQIAAFDGL